MEMMKIGYNPNLAEDIKKFFELSSSEDEIKIFLSRLEKAKPSSHDKLVSFVDKLEFVEHLRHVQNISMKNKCHFYDDKGSIVYKADGIDNDIGALNIYLILSCVDIFARLDKYLTFEEWLPKSENHSDFIDSIPIKEYIEKKCIEYKNSYAISSQFKNAIKNSSSDIATVLAENLTVFKNCKYGLPKEDEVGSNDIDEILTFLISIRNKYTHEGSRIYYPTNPICPYYIMVGATLKGDCFENRKENALRVAPGFNLSSTLEEIAIQLCRNQLNKELEIHSITFPL